MLQSSLDRLRPKLVEQIQRELTTIMSKKKPQDATMRNVAAGNKKTAKLQKKIQRLQKKADRIQAKSDAKIARLQKQMNGLAAKLQAPTKAKKEKEK